MKLVPKRLHKKQKRAEQESLTIVIPISLSPLLSPPLSLSLALPSGGDEAGAQETA